MLPTIAFGSISDMASTLAGEIGMVASACVIIGFAISAILFLTSAGDPSKLTQAKSAFVWAVVGTIVAVIAFNGEGFVNSLVGSP